MELHQLVHTLNYGDAISNEALIIQRIMRERGVESRIYSVHAHEKVKEFVTDYRKCESDMCGNGIDKSSCVLFHYSIASPLSAVFDRLTNVRRGVVYHNLTPPNWFWRYNPRVVADLEVGHKEFPEIIKKADFVIADSEYNCAEVRALGCAEVSVLPLAFDVERWKLPANPGIVAACRGHHGKNILHVGRVAPNKCIEDIIKAFYFYHHKIERKSKLWLIGIDIDTELYAFELRRLVHELRLQEAVEFVGGVHDSELRAFYENADLYMCMSEHEGFCVPLLEAMWFGVPIIAYDACAVKDTLGNAGFLLAHKSPAENAELMHMIINQAEIREPAVENGKRRVEQFGVDAFRDALGKLIY